MAKSGDYVRLNTPFQPCHTWGQWCYAILSEKVLGGWEAALVEEGDHLGRSSCTTVFLQPRSFRVVRRT